MRRLAQVLVILLAVAGAALAQPYANGPATTAQFPAGVVSLSGSQQTTSGPIPWVTSGQPGGIGSASIDAVLVGTTPGVTVTFLQSNSPSGPFTKWPASSAGGATTPVPSFLLSAANGADVGTDVLLARSAFVEIQIQNASGTNPVTPTVRFLPHP